MKTKPAPPPLTFEQEVFILTKESAIQTWIDLADIRFEVDKVAKLETNYLEFLTKVEKLRCKLNAK